MHAELLDHRGYIGQTQCGAIAGEKPEAVPSRNMLRVLPLLEQDVVEGEKDRRLKLLARLGEYALGNRTKQTRPTGHTSEEIVEFALQAARHPSGETGHQSREGQCAATSEVPRAHTVS